MEDIVDQELSNYWEPSSFLQNEDFEYDRFFLSSFFFPYFAFHLEILIFVSLKKKKLAFGRSHFWVV